MLKESHPEYGCERISDLLMRGPGLPASASTVGRVLRESGYELEEVETRPHEPVVKRFERARPNQLWQTDLFTFALRRQNRRVYAVAFMDDHSRFVTGFGVHGSASTAMVLEVLRSAVASYGAPAELLTDNGPQYVTWRGTSAFKKECERLGIRQIVARPKHPQTLGKVERFWGTLWRELVETALFLDLADAKQRIAFFIDHYNFHRPHQGLDGLVPADRFFEAAPQVRETLKARVRENALELAKAGAPRKPFYLTGQMGGQPFTLHAEGDRFYLTHENGRREEVALAGPAGGEGWGTAAIEEIGEGEDVPGTACPKEPSKELGHETPAPPGTSPLDEGLRQLAQSLAKGPASEGAAQSRKEVES
jgi:transposase InsO family protein